ncbi:MAG: diguanylate cyclase [Cyanobacteria bacterium SID2]|nr:diguanylate cyclase [Cyanobacteria bacterium SID2]
MNETVLQVLLVEDNPADATLIRKLIDRGARCAYQLVAVETLAEAVAAVTRETFSTILLDLTLPDSCGLDTLRRLKAVAPNAPIIILTGIDDEDLAVAALRDGAQDYSLKGHIQAETLVRSMRYAIERQQILQQLQRSEAALQQQLLRERLLSEVTDCIHRSFDLAEILQTTVDKVRLMFTCDRVLVQRCADDGRVTVVVESHHPDCDPAIGWHIGNPYPLIFSDLDGFPTDSPPFDLWSEDLCRIFNVRSRLTAPIWIDNCSSKKGNVSKPKLWGILSVHHCQSQRLWQTMERDLFEQIAHQLAIAIRQVQLYQTLEAANQELQRLASLDGLTQLANRRHFNTCLDREWRRCARGHRPLSLILCDIDFFKAYNDRYGHLAGDECLQEVARAIHSVIKRSSDVVARYGGEEFAAILPETEATAAFYLAESIREQVATLRIPHARSAVSSVVTLSVGIATRVPNPQIDSATIVAEADIALYDAKARGRNCVVLGERQGNSAH